MRPLLSWFAPDVALIGAAVTLFYCLFLFQGYQKLFRDSDAGWHIRTGEAILATGKLPRSDPYSFTLAGQPWFAWEWGADVITGAVHRAAGLRGVALFYGVVIATGVWLWFRLHWVLGGNFLLAGAMAAPLLTTCTIHWLARPHLIGWLFLVLALLRAETVHRPFSWRDGLMVAVFSALWANLHASFFLAPAIAVIYAIGRWRKKADSQWFLRAAVVAAVAPLANPYVWHLYQHLFRYLTDSELLARIAEFQSFDFHAPGAAQITIAVILGIAGGTLALTQRRYEHALLALAISATALRSARALPLVALMLLPIANAAITPLLDPRFQAYCQRLRAIDARQFGLAWAPILILAAFALLGVLPTGFPPDQFPVEAYSHIPENARLFAPDKFGGYLIYRSNGPRKVFFDGRSDFYGAAFLKRYSLMVQVRPGWREAWDSYHFTHALVPSDYPLIPALEQIGWQAVYEDKTATLLAANQSARARTESGARGQVQNLAISFVLQQNIGKIFPER